MKNLRFWAKIARFLAFFEAVFMASVALIVALIDPHLTLNQAMIALLMLMGVLAGSIFALVSLSRFFEGKA